MREPTHVQKYRTAMAKGDHAGILAALTADFGDRRRCAMAYIATSVEITRLENRIRLAIGFGAGVVVMLIVDVVARLF